MILGIYGGGGMGKTIVDFAKIINAKNHQWDKFIFIDDVLQSKREYGLDVFSFDEMRHAFKPDEIELSISLGEPEYREMLYNRIKAAGYSLARLVDPDAVIAGTARLGEGVIITKCLIVSDVVISDNSMVLWDAIIGHDVVVGSHTVIAVGAFIGGHCKIGNKVYVGVRAILRDRILVEDTAVLALGSVIVKSVPGDVVALGNPARFIKKTADYRVFDKKNDSVQDV